MGKIDYANDERYTAAYIAREAALILMTLGKKHTNSFGRSAFVRTELDFRILKRWGLDK
jgi:hypothetical protein